MDWRDFLFGIKGRINRAKYWLVIGISIASGIATVIVGLVLINVLGQVGTVAAFIVGAVVAIASIWINVTTGIKRLHDREKPGWWLWLFWFVPTLCNLITPDDAVAIALLSVGACISIWGFVELACLKGTDGPNTYGPDPLAAKSS